MTAQKCDVFLQTPSQYIRESGRRFNPCTGIPYHETHKSSKKNNFFGEIKACERWLIDESIFNHLPEIPSIHPFNSPFPDETTITKESNGVCYAYERLLLPLVTVLKNLWRHLEFVVDHETVVSTSVETSDGWEEVQGRVDMVVAARNVGSEEDFQIILLYEAKKPGSLHYWEWMCAENGLEGRLMGNAFIIAVQGRKYCSATGHGQIIFGDSDKMVGMRLKEEDREYWDTPRALSADLFFQGDRESFLKSLVAVSIEKLAELELI